MTPTGHASNMKSKLLQVESLIIMAKMTPTLATVTSVENAVIALHAAMLAALEECGEGCGMSSAQVTLVAGANKSA